MDVTIPANTTAYVILPEKETELEFGSDSWHYEYATDTKLELFNQYVPGCWMVQAALNAQ